MDEGMEEKSKDNIPPNDAYQDDEKEQRKQTAKSEKIYNQGKAKTKDKNNPDNNEIQKTNKEIMDTKGMNYREYKQHEATIPILGELNLGKQQGNEISDTTKKEKMMNTKICNEQR